MSPIRVLRGLFLGGVGGFLGWLLTEFLPLPYPFAPARFEQPGAVLPLVHPASMGLLGAVLGIAIGGALGLSEGVGEGTRSRFTRTMLAFLLAGFFGGFLGLSIGQQLYGVLGGNPNTASLGASDFLPQLFARALGWALIGLFMGVALGLPNLSIRRMINGAVGGGMGGFLAGAVFQVMAFTRLFGGMQSRLVGFVILGAAIGFFISLVAEALKRVWVKVLIGRNEGREHVVDQAIAYVGRDELADIPVFLDPAVPRRIASFRLTGGRYALHAESNALPILVNGQSLQPAQVLRDGDAIQFGRVTLGYFEKATATGSSRPVDRIALADMSIPSLVPGATPIPTGGNVCQFCGEMRTAGGGCACSVPDGGYGSPVGAAAPMGGYSDPGYADPGYGGYQQPGGYADPGGYGAAPQPAYGATMMDQAPMGYGPSAGPALTATVGPYAGQSFPLGSEIGIGRDASQEIALAGDTTASRRHARVYYGPSGWMIRDEGSSNGTWVNGVRIQEQPLYPGDDIRIGQTHLRFDG